MEIIFTGGSVSIERLFAKSSQIINGFIKKAGSFADDVFRALDKLISLIRKGADHFASFIRQVLDDFFEWLKNLFKSGKADEVLEGVSFVKRGKYLGQALDDFDIHQLKTFLSKFKVELQIGPAKGSFKVDGFFYPSGKAFEIIPQNAALFITDGKIMKLVLRENATVYELLHELMHFRHCKSIGIKKYFDLGKQGIQGTIVRERYVFDKMVEHSRYLNREELRHANKYMNWHFSEYGITDNVGNPMKIDFSFDLKKIPKKRQKI